jgi:hypothetical protein
MKDNRQRIAGAAAVTLPLATLSLFMAYTPAAHASGSCGWYSCDGDVIGWSGQCFEEGGGTSDSNGGHCLCAPTSWGITVGWMCS